MNIPKIIPAFSFTILLFIMGCAYQNSAPKKNEERDFLVSMIKWYWEPGQMTYETEITDSGNFVRNIKPSIDKMRKVGFFTEEFCNQVEKWYVECEEKYKHDDLDNYFPCMDIDPLTDSKYDVLDSIRIVNSQSNAEVKILTAEIFGANLIGGEHEFKRNYSVEVVFHLIRENGSLKIDHSSAMEKAF